MLAQEVLQFIEENDVKFIRLAFTDLFGQLKNIAIQPNQLSTAFETGIATDATAVEGGMAGELVLRPDPDTLCILPWRPQSSRVCRLLCNLWTAGGEPYALCSRDILRRASGRVLAGGDQARIATECEFYLLETDERGEPTLTPHDAGGYMDVAPPDKCEDVRRDICLTLEQMNIRPESSHHERGPGQNEVDFHRADPMTAADHYVAFVHAVRAVSARYGLHATFMPKPLAQSVGNGLHVNLAFYRGERNLLRMENGELGAEARAALAGILRRLPEMTLFLNPLPASYDRLAAPDAFRRLDWSTRRGLNAVRVPMPQERFARVQVLSPDPSMNAYLGFALLMQAALEGMEERASFGGGGQLPATMEEAAKLAENSAFVKSVLPAEAVDAYLLRARTLMAERARDPEGQLMAHILRV